MDKNPVFVSSSIPSVNLYSHYDYPNLTQHIDWNLLAIFYAAQKMNK